jgi:hypothetical protein
LPRSIGSATDVKRLLKELVSVPKELVSVLDVSVLDFGWRSASALRQLVIFKAGFSR